MEPLRIAAMPDDAVAVASLLIESEAHVGQQRVRSKLWGVHQGDGFRPQNSRSLILPLLQMGEHEVGYILRRNRRTSGRADTDNLEWLCLVRWQSVSLGHHRLKRRRQ